MIIFESLLTAIEVSRFSQIAGDRAEYSAKKFHVLFKQPLKPNPDNQVKFFSIFLTRELNLWQEKSLSYRWKCTFHNYKRAQLSEIFERVSTNQSQYFEAKKLEIFAVIGKSEKARKFAIFVHYLMIVQLEIVKIII